MKTLSALFPGSVISNVLWKGFTTFIVSEPVIVIQMSLAWMSNEFLSRNLKHLQHFDEWQNANDPKLIIYNIFQSC